MVHETDKIGAWWRSPGVWVGLAVVVALVLRLAHLAALVGSDPFLITPVIDAYGYHIWGVEILDDPVGKQAFYQSPAYPYAVGLIYALFGVDWIAVGVVQAIVGALGVLVLAAIGRRMIPDGIVLSGPWVGVVAGWMWALYKPMIFYDTLVLKVEFTLFVCMLCLYGFIRGCLPEERFWRAASWMFFAGVMMTLAGLFRGNLYLAFPALTGWLLLRWLLHRRFGGDKDWEALSFQRLVGLGTAFVVGFALLIGVVVVRNYTVSGQWVFSNANSGAVMYIGNNPYSPHGDYMRLPFVRANPLTEEIDFRNEASRRAGREMTSSEAATFWRQEAVDYIFEDPVMTVRRVVHKLAITAESYELGDNYSLKFHQEFSWVLKLPLVGWALVLALAMGGLLDLKLIWRRSTPVVLMALTYLVSLIIFFVRSRYRIPLVPFCILIAAVEVVALWHLIAERQTKPLALRGTIILGMLGLSLWLGASRSDAEKLSSWWSSLGLRHMEAGDLEGGLKLLKRGVAEDESDALLWMQLGQGYALAGDSANAAKACGRSVELKPSRHEARDCAAGALFGMGQYQESMTLIGPAINKMMPSERFLLVAALLEKTGERARAIKILKQCSARYPEFPDALAHLARLLRTSDPEVAKGYLDRALKSATSPEHVQMLQSIANAP